MTRCLLGPVIGREGHFGFCIGTPDDEAFAPVEITDDGMNWTRCTTEASLRDAINDMIENGRQPRYVMLGKEVLELRP